MKNVYLLALSTVLLIGVPGCREKKAKKRPDKARREKRIEAKELADSRVKIQTTPEDMPGEFAHSEWGDYSEFGYPESELSEFDESALPEWWYEEFPGR